MRERTQRLAISAMLLSIIMILGYVEFTMNLSFQGIKPGLSNCVLLLCLYWLGIKQSIVMMLAKVVLQFIFFNKGFPAFMLSLSGGVVSMAAMILVIYRLKGFGPVAAGITGGIMHNIGQVAYAILFLGLPPAYIIISGFPLLMIGAAMGGLTGGIAVTIRHLMPPQRRRRFGLGDEPLPHKGPGEKDRRPETGQPEG